MTTIIVQRKSKQGRGKKYIFSLFILAVWICTWAIPVQAAELLSQYGRTEPVAGSNAGEFDNPFDVAVDSSGNIYVADSYNNRIQKLTISTGVWSEWGKSSGGSGSGLGEFNEPGGVTVDSSGNVYVAHPHDHRIQKLTVSTGVWNEFGGYDEGFTPVGVAVDSSGNMYVADTFNNRIQKLIFFGGVCATSCQRFRIGYRDSN